MDYDKIKEELKGYILKELEIAKEKDSTFQDVLYARNRAYGALMFVNNMVIPYDEELSEWWNNEMRDSFIKFFQRKHLTK